MVVFLWMEYATSNAFHFNPALELAVLLWRLVCDHSFFLICNQTGKSNMVVSPEAVITQLCTCICLCSKILNI